MATRTPSWTSGSPGSTGKPPTTWTSARWTGCSGSSANAASRSPSQAPARSASPSLPWTPCRVPSGACRSLARRPSPRSRSCTWTGRTPYGTSSPAARRSGRRPTCWPSACTTSSSPASGASSTPSSAPRSCCTWSTTSPPTWWSSTRRPGTSRAGRTTPHPRRHGPHGPATAVRFPTDGGQPRKEAALPAPQGDRPGFTGRLNRDTIVFRDPAASLGRPTHCTCPTSPWCRGPHSQDWAVCSRGCRSCHPRERRRRQVGEHLRGEQVDG
jgi:hypothetical protein